MTKQNTPAINPYNPITEPSSHLWWNEKQAATPTEVKEPEEKVIKKEPPIWYEYNCIYQWLVNQHYAPEIADELAIMIPPEFQRAYAKGWEMAYNNYLQQGNVYEYVYYPKTLDAVNEANTPTTLLSEGKETVEEYKPGDTFLIQNNIISLNNQTEGRVIYVNTEEPKYGVEFKKSHSLIYLHSSILEQSQHTAKEIEALQARVEELEYKINIYEQTK